MRCGRWRLPSFRGATSTPMRRLGQMATVNPMPAWERSVKSLRSWATLVAQKSGVTLNGALGIQNVCTSYLVLFFLFLFVCLFGEGARARSIVAEASVCLEWNGIFFSLFSLLRVWGRCAFISSHFSHLFYLLPRTNWRVIPTRS